MLEVNRLLLRNGKTITIVTNKNITNNSKRFYIS